MKKRDTITAKEYQNQFGQKKSKRKSKFDCFIGIDPDVTKSGVATYIKGKPLLLDNYTFFELFTYLIAQSRVNNDISMCVVIEAGWLNKSNWHAKKKGSAAVNAQIGQRTGANHEVGKKIVEMCEYLELDYQLVKPTKSKVKADYFKKITKYEKLTNQDQRDAAMLVFGR